MDDQASYVCPCCGEEIVIPVDVSQGVHQGYVEDCPVCCSPVVLRIEVHDDGRVDVAASPE